MSAGSLGHGRAANGEGSVYEYPKDSGRWFAKVSLPARRRVTRGPFESRAKARTALGRLRREIEDESPDLTRQTTGQFLAVWLDESVRPSVRPTTYAAYEYQVRVHLTPAIGGVMLHSLTPEHVQTMLNGIARSGRSPSTVSQTRRVLRRALQQAVEWRRLRDNPAAIVRAPRIPTAERSILEPDQARALLAAATKADDHLEPLYALALASGLRQGELLGLRWSRVDLDSATLRVDGQLQRVGKEWRIVEPKSARGTRTIALPALAVAALRRRRQQQIQDRLRAGEFWEGTDADLVFTTRLGRPLMQSNLHRAWKRALANAGLPTSVRFHDLRHAAASYMAASGVPQRMAMEILGHSSAQMTTGVYSHVLDAQRREAALRIDSLLG